MNPENFIVRPKRRPVERFAKPEAWERLSDEDFAVLARTSPACRPRLYHDPVPQAHREHHESEC